MYKIGFKPIHIITCESVGAVIFDPKEEIIKGSETL